MRPDVPSLTKLVIAFTAATAAVMPANSKADQTYTITDLGNGGSGGIANAINSSGQVTGVLNTSSPAYAFLYSGGAISAIPTIGGSGGGSSAANQGNAIDNAGDVVGLSSTSANTFPEHAFLYSGGKVTDLGSLAGASGGSSAYGINNTGMIVGTSLTASGDTHAFSYSNGKMTDLGSLVAGGNSFAQAVNDAGHIAGAADLTNSHTGTPQHAILYDGTFHDLGTLGTGVNSVALAINNKDQVVGDSEIAPNTFPTIHAFIYSDGKMSDLGTLGGTRSAANAINNLGQVVGFSTTSSSSQNHAFVYSGGIMSDLNSMIDPASGWTLSIANGINDSGQIVGFGTNSRGQADAFLLTPNVVPEPGSLVLAGIGLAVTSFLYLRKSKPSHAE